jgi:hypothetical protein
LISLLGFDDAVDEETGDGGGGEDGEKGQGQGGHEQLGVPARGIAQLEEDRERSGHGASGNERDS